jgi:hypothetical protein
MLIRILIQIKCIILNDVNITINSDQFNIYI